MTARTGWRRAAAVLALPLVLAACGTQHAGSGAGSPDGLPLLHVGSRGAGGADAAMAGGATGGATDGYPLVGPLPDGPAAAHVYRYGPRTADEADVAALATALHLAADPVRHAHGWQVDGPTATLRVRDDGTWSFWRDDATCPFRVDVDAADLTQVAVGCAAPLPSTTEAVSGSTALAVAAPVLAASDATGTPVVQRSDVAYVRAGRVVDGRTVVGADTSVSVDAAGVRDANGTVGTPSTGPEYPILSAAKALDLLRAMPKPAIACMVGATCPGVGPVHVTGATLGLVPGDDAGTPVLLPAWLFSTQEDPSPLAVMAVADAYLADPEPAPGASGSASAVPGSTGGGSPGSDGRGAATSFPEPPATASDLPGTPVVAPPVLTTGVRISRATVSGDGLTLTLHGTGGVCATYRADAKADSTHVYAVLTATLTSTPGQACPDLAREVEASVHLDAPLGSRTVLDASDPAMPAVRVG